ncbi:aminopeptidase [Roseinatronobacter alkalisoli]|uniref:Aminopeptidase n=1 Tax=Roseinatronobacter alkalisoli TaxID=3028235 RepID=A0ABT5T613_9RHOB|nr:aminopeptidase [Roseinatronobacter sp. HJB301]MDD7970160.1 aminopeptidase [Roseinatronobacter sp. HJB301]
MTQNSAEIFPAHDGGPALDPDLLTGLAKLAVHVGLNLQQGQDLVMTTPASALPLARAITAEAYRAGAGLVTPIVSDRDMTLARFHHAQDASFDRAPDWLYDAMAKAYENGAARLALVGEDPFLLSHEDASKVGRANRANAAAYRPALAPIAGFHINWSIIACPTPDWAQRMFPDLAPQAAFDLLAQAIRMTARLDQPDPVAAWAAHNAHLAQRCARLNDARFDSLHFRGPGTDLRVGLADGHFWQGGASVARNGVRCNPNIPTEEVFTTPHAARVDGVARATKPLSHHGSLIEDITMRFENGRVVEARAARGDEVLQDMLSTDDGAARLGEVALVPHSSPVSRSGHLYFNTLFDENAASHIAMGQCYASCLEGGDGLSKEDIAARGGNESLIHVDWMIGSAQMDVDGLHAGGDTVALMRAGEWVDF